MNFFNDNFIRISKTMNSCGFYRHILTAEEKIVMFALWDSIAYNENGLYGNGLLVSNITHRTLQRKIGRISYSTVRRCVDKLIELGVIIKLKKKSRSNRYLVGFRTQNKSDKSYLIFHLAPKYENKITEEINKQSENVTERWHSPRIDNFSNYCIDPEVREFIFRNADKVNIITKIYKNGENIYQFLFKRNDYYRRLNQIFKSFKNSR